MEANKRGNQDQNLITKKPPLKRKALPPVRHTRTSYNRILKSNPDMKLQHANGASQEIINKKDEQNVKDGPFQRTWSIRYNSSQKSDLVKINVAGKGPTWVPILMPTIRANVNPQLDDPRINNQIIQQNLGSTNNDDARDARGANVNPQPVDPIINNQIIQPDLGSTSNNDARDGRGAKLLNIHCDNPKTKNLIVKASGSNVATNPQTHNKALRKKKIESSKIGGKQLNRSRSADGSIDSEDAFKGISPIPEKPEATTSKFVFKTPTAYRWRSRSFSTPQSNSRVSLFHKSTPAPYNLEKLQERLNKWLESRGKPPALFHNLKLFGAKTSSAEPDLDLTKDEENKENIEEPVKNSDSYESLNISNKNSVNGEDDFKGLNKEDVRTLAKEAINDLLKLIEENYPPNQCKAWLDLIKEKCEDIVNEPEYWECRAALEQCAGNVQNAVEFYKEAIVHGAEVSNVDKSLDQLLKKFSLLNIESNIAEPTPNGISRSDRIVAEARSVFISSIINFAVYKRSMKKKSEATDTTKLYVVPVRRSARLSVSNSAGPPGVQLCRSLKEIDISSDHVSFESNKALC